MVEVFKTNVSNPITAHIILDWLQQLYPAYPVNFDLSDCDRILRVKNGGDQRNSLEILKLLRAVDIEIDILNDASVPNSSPHAH